MKSTNYAEDVSKVDVSKAGAIGVADILVVE